MKKYELIENLKLFQSLDFVDECITILQSDNYIFNVDNKPFDKAALYESLKRRVRSANVDKIYGLNEVVNKLGKVEPTFVKLIKISGNVCTYFLFYSEELHSLIGIYKNCNINKNKYLKLEAEYRRRGLNEITEWHKP